MRDLIVTILVFGSLPLILRKPFFGVLVWSWLGLMNPHRLCWGFALSMPFAQLVALALLGSVLIHYREEAKGFELRPLAVLLGFWWLWMLITTFFALFPAGAWFQWDKVWKIMLLAFITLFLLKTRFRIEALVWTIAISLGFYGVKGGIFTLATGGGYAVYGPAGTFIGGNNEIGLALIMTVPLLRYIQLQTKDKLVRNGMMAAMLLTLLSIVATHSRGAFLGLAIMVGYLVMKSKQKGPLIAILLLSLPVIFVMMPEEYYSRLDTIDNYQEDGSAMGRINAWWAAYYLALDHPITGGGFTVFVPWIFARYAPNPGDFHDAHSIYFEVLGEHGFVGLAIFLSIGLGSLISLNRTRKFASRYEQLSWMRDLSAMLSVSLVGYAVSGAFLGLAYFDLYYTLVVIAIALSMKVSKYQREGVPEPEPEPEAQEEPTQQSRAALGPGGVRRKPNLIKRAFELYNRL